MTESPSGRDGPALRSCLAQDLDRYRDFVRGEIKEGRANPRRLFGYAFCAFGLYATVAYRLRRAALVGRAGASVLARLPLGLAELTTRLLQRLTEALYDIRIDPEADIGPGLYIGHFGGVYIGRCRVGRSCAVHQQAKLGAPRLTGPIIGDHVWIGPHARIAPQARVGDGATILSGAQVDSDIPPRALAGGAPARIIRRDYDNGPLMRFYADD